METALSVYLVVGLATSAAAALIAGNLPPARQALIVLVAALWPAALVYVVWTIAAELKTSGRAGSADQRRVKTTHLIAE